MALEQPDPSLIDAVLSTLPVVLTTALALLFRFR